MAARLLLLTGYLFFYSSQFNYRYYDIANFFVYKTGDVIDGGVTVRQKIVFPEMYRHDTRRPAHLSVDKRYDCRMLVQPAVTDIWISAPSYILVTRKALPPPVVYSIPDLPTNALRGPPSA